MTSSSLVRTIRETWPLLVVGALVGLLVAGLISWATPRTYAASASVYVAGIDAGPAGDAVAGALISPQRAASYRQLLTSDRVLEPVAERLRVTALPGQVSVVSQPNSAVFTVGVQANDPAQSAAIANAVAQRFTEVIAELEGPGSPGTTPAVVASVIDQARPSAVPASPRVPTNLLVGFVVGALAAAGAVVVRSALDTSIHSQAALRAAVGRPVLGSLPPRPVGRRASSSDTEPGFEEAARQLRARISLAAADDGSRVLVLAGAEKGSGSTTTVCGLAAAAPPDGRVLVVDADLRRPAVGERLGLVDGDGLADVLSRSIPVESAVRRHRHVDVLTAGSTPDDPAALLSSQAMGDVLIALRAQYDVILVDVPSLQSSVDALLVARHADTVILTCRERKTSRALLDEAVDALALAGVGLLGAVLTGSRSGAVERRSGRAAGATTRHGVVDDRTGPDGAAPLDGERIASEASRRQQVRGG